MAERTALGELARHGALRVATPEYAESAGGPAAAVTLFCADGSMLQVFARGALERDPERIQDHQRRVRRRLGALGAQVRLVKRALEWVPRLILLVGLGGALREIVRAVLSTDVSALAALGWSLLWSVGAGSLWWALRRVLQWWARRAVRELVQRWLGPEAAAVKGSPRS